MRERVVELCDACAPLIETCKSIAHVRMHCCKGCRQQIHLQLARRVFDPSDPPEGRLIPFRTAPGGGERRP